MMLELQARGCHNINVVTSEDMVFQIIEALPLARAGGLRFPIVYNTSASIRNGQPIAAHSDTRSMA